MRGQWEIMGGQWEIMEGQWEVSGTYIMRGHWEIIGGQFSQRLWEVIGSSWELTGRSDKFPFSSCFQFLKCSNPSIWSSVIWTKSVNSSEALYLHL